MANWGWRNKLPSAHDFRTDARARNENERIVCIVNPRAAAGRAGDRLEELRRAVDRAFFQWDVRVTEGPGHATELARAAVEEGADLVAAVGGDGTSNEVVNGFFDDGQLLSRKSTFTIIPWGTGSDLARSLKSPSNLADALWVASTGMTLPVDVGHARFETEDGPGQRVFVNVAGFGANGDVVDRANRASKRLGGRLTFLQATVGSLLNYRPPEVEVEWTGPDGPGQWSGELLSAFVANGHYCGGGMHVGKGGSMHDGAFDLTLLPSHGAANNIRQSWRLYDGSAWRVAGARRAYASELTARVVRSSEPVLLDLDGEQPGMLEATFRLLPRQLHTRGGWLRSPLLENSRTTWRPET